MSSANRHGFPGRADVPQRRSVEQERRRRRPRFHEESNQPAQAGAIAVSFAIVSRKHWPR